MWQYLRLQIVKLLWLATHMYILSLSNNWMHFKRNFAYTIKEPETSIRDNEVTVSRDMIPYTFLKERVRFFLEFWRII